MKKGKMFLALFMGILITIGSAFSVLGQESSIQPRACSHSSTDQTTTISNPRQYTASAHLVDKRVLTICNTCNAVLRNDFFASVQEPHALVNAGDHHYSSTGTHIWRFQCTVCGYSGSTTTVCPGPPCPTPYSVF